MIKSQSSRLAEVSGSASIVRLGAALDGELILPGDPQYETARQVWNGAIDRHPAFIVRSKSANDVKYAIDFARSNHLDIAVRGGGHNPAGFSTCEGGMVIDLSPMQSISVDPAERTARAKAGLTLGELIGAAQAHGLATPTGTVSDVGVGGLTVGGGVGFLIGKYGLTCDNVRSFEVVTADGRTVQANANENSDLFWGLRGGGGNFGIVTAFEYQLHPVSTILGGRLVHPLSRMRKVLEFYRDFTSKMPDELTVACAILAGPDRSIVVAMAACFCGDLAEGERVVAPLRKFGPPLADTIQPMPYAGVFGFLDPTYRRGRPDRMKGNGVMALTDQVIDVVVDSAEKMTSAYSQILIFPIHGAASRVGLGGTAFAFREKHYEILQVAAWEDGPEEPHSRWLTESWQAVKQFASPLAYVNFIDDEGPARVRAAYGPNYERLVALKNKYDPDNVFHLNQNIKPNIGLTPSVGRT